MRAAYVAAGLAGFAGLVWGGGVKMSGGGVFNGGSKGGETTISNVRLGLQPLQSKCIHGWNRRVDFVPVFEPEGAGLTVGDLQLAGFTTNQNGTLRLEIVQGTYASGSVRLGTPPLSWGEAAAEESIHICEGGVQDWCGACGRLHGTDDDVTCSHADMCAAFGGKESQCSCPTMFLRVNWDDDDLDGDEDRTSSAAASGDDELVAYRALGVSRTCWCHTEEMAGTHLSGLASSSELRLWAGSGPASETASEFRVEAVSATTGIGTGRFWYDIHDYTNGLYRSVVCHVTAANIEMRPDWDDSGDVDGYDRYLLRPDVRPERWQIRVRDTPYLLQLASECPPAATLTLGESVSSGIAPALLSSATGQPTALEKNALQDVLVDTSAGEGDVTLTYALGVTAAETNLTDTLQIHIVDTSVEERWIPAGPASSATYDYSDVDGDVWWSVWRVTDDGYEWIDGDYSSSFTLEGLAAGDYEVDVYFDGIYEDGWQGYYTSGSLHVVDVRLERLYETANPANFIFNPTPKDDYTDKPVREEVMEDGWLHTYGTPRNNLYVVARPSENVLGVTVRLCVTPSNSADRVICAVYCNGELKSECPLETNGNARLQVPVDEGNAVMTNCLIRAGLDLNGDGTLSYEESQPLMAYAKGNEPKYATIVGVSEGRSDSEDTFISFVSEGVFGSVVGVFLPFARSLLSVYYNGDTMEIGGQDRPVITRRVQLNAKADRLGFTEWLTHNSGAAFDSDCIATITEYEWDSDSSFAQRLTDCSPFAPWIAYQVGSGQDRQTLYLTTDTGRAVVSNFNAVVRSLAAERMGNSPNGSVAVFSNTNGWDDTPLVEVVLKSMSPANVPGRTVCVGSRGSYDDAMLTVAASAVTELTTDGSVLKNIDAFYAIGRGRITQPSFWISARKTGHLFGEPTYELYQVGFSCTISDLYDFNFEDGSLSRSAAILQLGYGQSNSGRNHGQIFRHQVKLNAVYTNPQ